METMPVTRKKLTAFTGRVVFDPLYMYNWIMGIIF